MHAFTLIELLVVIAIIALLGTLTIPAIGRAMEGANGIKCLQNLRLCAQGVISYAGDNNGELPREYAPSRWNVAVGSYVGFPTMLTVGAPTRAEAAKRYSAFFCPQCKASWTGNQWWISDYAPNRNIIKNAGTFEPALNLVTVNKPSQKVVLMENGNLGNPLDTRDGEMRVNFLVGGYSPPATAQATQRGDLGFRHPPVRNGSLANSVCNMAFLDGHVEVVKHNDPRLRSQTELNRLFNPLDP
jgi:prepilin-type N-terminal cleavage/methylation domain-containing protein/prepilin-type processing-associated H-X9-DG protein